MKNRQIYSETSYKQVKFKLGSAESARLWSSESIQQIH